MMFYKNPFLELKFSLSRGKFSFILTNYILHSFFSFSFHSKIYVQKGHPIFLERIHYLSL